jgi:hypothetical protein
MVEGWLGPQGQGKTYCLVCHCVRAKLAGNAVYSNLAIEGCGHFDTWDELMYILEGSKTRGERVTVAVDEAGKFLSSRFWQKADPRMLTLLQERRKIAKGVDLVYSVPSWRMIDTQLRDVTQRVHVCRRIGGSEYSHDGGRAPLLFLERWLWPDDVTTEHMGPRKRAKAHRKVWLWFTPEIAALYETGVLDMDKPMAAHVSQRPDYYAASEVRR